MADPTRRQIAMMADEVGITDYSAAVRLVQRAFEVSRSASAALAADGPAVPEGREPASVVDQPSDEEIIQEAIKADLVYRPIDDESHVFSGFVESHALNTYVLSFARAVLARWGRQPVWSADDVPPGPFSERELREQWNQQADEYNQWDSLDSCEQLAWAQACAIQRDRNAKPTPSAEGEAAELVALIRQISLAWEPDACLLGNMTAGQLTRAADLLAQRPEPVPVSERLPELRGMFERILCVARSSVQRPVRNIELADRLIGAVVYWAALPLPAGEVE